jgi:hypothetical protein
MGWRVGEGRINPKRGHGEVERGSVGYSFGSIESTSLEAPIVPGLSIPHSAGTSGCQPENYVDLNRCRDCVNMRLICTIRKSFSREVLTLTGGSVSVYTYDWRLKHHNATPVL